MGKSKKSNPSRHYSPPHTISASATAYLRQTYEPFLWSTLQMLKEAKGQGAKPDKKSKKEREDIMNDIFSQWLTTRLSLGEVMAAYAQLWVAHAKGDVPDLNLALTLKIKRILKRSSGLSRFEINVYFMSTFLRESPEANFVAENWTLAEQVVGGSAKDQAKVDQMLGLLQDLYTRRSSKPDAVATAVPAAPATATSRVTSVKPEVKAMAATTKSVPIMRVALEPPTVNRNVAMVTQHEAGSASPPIEMLAPSSSLAVAPDPAPAACRGDERATEIRQQRRPMPSFRDKEPTGFDALEQFFLKKLQHCKGLIDCDDPAAGAKERTRVLMAVLNYEELDRRFKPLIGKDGKETTAFKATMFREIYRVLKEKGLTNRDQDVDKKRISNALDWGMEFFGSRK